MCHVILHPEVTYAYVRAGCIHMDMEVCMHMHMHMHMYMCTCAPAEVSLLTKR